MENKDDLSLGYAITPNGEETNGGVDDFMNNMLGLMLLAIFGTFGGAHPEEPEKKD